MEIGPKIESKKFFTLPMKYLTFSGSSLSFNASLRALQTSKHLSLTCLFLTKYSSSVHSILRWGMGHCLPFLSTWYEWHADPSLK